MLCSRMVMACISEAVRVILLLFLSLSLILSCVLLVLCFMFMRPSNLEQKRERYLALYTKM